MKEENKTRVLLEDIRSQFKAFGESLEIVSDDTKEIKGRLTNIESDINHLNISDMGKTAQIDAIKGRLTSIEQHLKQIDNKLGKEEVKELEKRLVFLEKKLEA